MKIGQKWFTCTPYRFPGDQSFFNRESGLLCKGFQEIGVDSKAVMPGPAVENDQANDLIRTDYKNLEDADWWRQFNLDGVVLYAWGLPKYTAIARAINQAGVFLISSIDASGLYSPYAGGLEYARLTIQNRISNYGWMAGPLIAAASIARSLFPNLYDKRRLEHLSHADKVTMVTPQAVEIMKLLAQKFGFPGVAINTKYVPHPQLPTYTYDGTPKENLIVTVGRWDRKSWFQKNPQLLLNSLERFLESRSDYHSIIVGSSVGELAPLLNKISQNAAARITLIPFLSPDDLRDAYRRSKIGFWTSRHEGQQGTGAQALCCGCSVVSTTGIAMSCFAHYASRGSGRQSIRNNAWLLADALKMEANAWDEGDRDPLVISNRWVKEFHHAYIARRLLELAEKTPNSIIASNP